MYTHVYFLGTGHVASKCIEILAATTAKEHIQCLSVEHEEMSNLQAVCTRLQIPYLFFQASDLEDFLCHISKKSLIISAHNQYIFSKKVVENPYLTIINFHNAYLPFYRGRNAPTWEIFYQEAFGGATWHEVEATIDTGGIIVQEKVPIAESDTALSLLLKSARAGIRLFQDHVNDFLAGNYTLYRPTNPGTLFLSKDIPNQGYIDSAWAFDKTYAFLRAMDYEMLDIIPKPRLHKNGVIYEISDYTIDAIDKNRKSDNLYLVENVEKGICIYCQLKPVSN